MDDKGFFDSLEKSFIDPGRPEPYAFAFIFGFVALVGYQIAKEQKLL